MAPSGEQVNDHARGDQGGAEPLRQAVGLWHGSVLDDLDLLQEESETRYHEAESHQGQAGANPGEEGSFGSQVVAEGCGGLSLCGPIHCTTSKRGHARLAEWRDRTTREREVSK